MRRDYLREYLQRVNEGYELAATPASCRIYDLIGKPASSQEQDDQEVSRSRARLLMVGIDVKYIVKDFLETLAEEHGSRRAERFNNYILDGYLERYHSAHRYQILDDRKRLSKMVHNYRKWGSPY